MRRYACLALLCALITVSCAQTTKEDLGLLQEARTKYDTPFNRDLQSFDCDIAFSWKDHFLETTRVGDEGTDEELEQIFQPIRNHVTVTGQKVVVTPGMTEEAIDKLPHGGMAERLLQHAVQKSLNTWLPAATNAILPSPDTLVRVKKISSGYNLAFKMQDMEVDMLLGPDMRLQSAAAKGPQSDHFETTFIPGQHGFLLASWTINEDANAAPGHRLIFTYTYQNVEGLQLPQDVTVTRESHHEVWRYRLANCGVKTNK